MTNKQFKATVVPFSITLSIEPFLQLITQIFHILARFLAVERTLKPEL